MTDGLIVVDKPAGLTSHQVVGRLRRILGTRKVGHAGTLDPMATGVLLLGVGRATRLLGHLALTGKSYTATIRLGEATTTDDAEGEVIHARGAAGLPRAEIEAAMTAYRGRIRQVPSAVSAIKVNGQRAYARVRAGEQVELAAREVTVSRFDLIEVTAVDSSPPGGSGADPERSGGGSSTPYTDVEVEVDCSSGTYIRALARDLGRDLGVGGHLTVLRRTRVGPFTLDDPHLNPEALAQPDGTSVPLISPAAVARRCFAVIELDQATAAGVRHGRPLDRPVPADPTALLAAGELLALYRPEGAGAVPVAVFVGG